MSGAKIIGLLTPKLIINWSDLSIVNEYAQKHIDFKPSTALPIMTARKLKMILNNNYWALLYMAHGNYKFCVQLNNKQCI